MAGVLLMVAGFGAVVLVDDLPLWAGPLLGVLLLACVGGPAALRLLGTPRAGAVPARWPSAPLSTEARWVTIAIALLLAISSFTSVLAIGFGLVTAAVMLAVAVASFHPGGRWGLARAGIEWGRAQWLGFGLSVAVLFTVSLLAVIEPPSVGIAGFGALLVVVPLASSLLARPRR